MLLVTTFWGNKFVLPATDTGPFLLLQASVKLAFQIQVAALDVLVCLYNGYDQKVVVFGTAALRVMAM
jgi:hypothetical protein